MIFEKTIMLPPVTKKNSQRIITVHGRPCIIPSKKYKEYEKDCGWYLNVKAGWHPIQYPVNVKTIFYMPTRRRVDLVNLQEAILDILVKYGIIEDDNKNIVASMDGSRVFYDKEKPRTEITITEAIG